MIQAFLKDDSGTTAIEYGLIAGLISVAIFAAVMSLGDSVESVFTSVNDDMIAAIGDPAVEPSDPPVEIVALQPVLDNADITPTPSIQ